jgi:hypothetical protein
MTKRAFNQISECKIEYEDIAHYTKFIKIFLLKNIINNSSSILEDSFFPFELVLLIIDRMHYSIKKLHKIPIISPIEAIEYSMLKKDVVLKRLVFQFGEKNVKLIEQPKNMWVNYSITIFKKEGRFIVTNYLPNYRVVYQGNIAGDVELKNIVNLCLTR